MAFGPVRRTLQNPEPAGMATHEYPAKGRQAPEKPAQQSLKMLLGATAQQTVHALDPPPIRALRAANAGFCGQACSSM